MTQANVVTNTEEKAANAPTARRDFALLWSGQTLSLFGDQFMVLALPLLAVTVLGVSAATAALLSFALCRPARSWSGCRDARPCWYAVARRC